MNTGNNKQKLSTSTPKATSYNIASAFCRDGRAAIVKEQTDYTVIDVQTLLSR